MTTIMDTRPCVTRTITAPLRAVVGVAYIEAANEDQDIKNVTTSGDNGLHVADLSRNTTLPLSDNGLSRYRTTLDFDARDPLVASPHSVDVITRFESETRKYDAYHADSDDQ